MPSPLDIANQALADIGTRSTIASFTEDSNEAVAVSQQYDSTRLQLLRMAPWDFASKHVNLTLLKALPGTPENPSTSLGTWSPSYPAPPWLYSYAYPSDCVFMRYLIPQYVPSAGGTPIFSGLNFYSPYTGQRYVKFKKAGDTDTNGEPIVVVLSDLSQAIACYTYDAQNTELFDSSFVQAFIKALGAELTMQLVGDKDLAVRLQKAANDVILEARARDGNEGPEVNDVMPDWMTIRGTGPTSISDNWSTYIDYGPMFGGYVP